MISWGDVVVYLTYLRAGGRARGTVRLREHHLRRLAGAVPDVLRAGTDDLVVFCAEPGWAPETRRSVASSLRGFYAWALATGRLDRDPAAGLPTVRIPVAVPRPAPAGAVARARTTADQRGRLLVDLAHLQGLRCAEIAGLRIGDIGERDLFVRGKGGRARRLPLRDDLAGPLQAWIGGRRGFVFPGRDHGHLSPGHVSRLLSRLLADYTGHQLRHAAATRWYQDGGRDLLAVQQLLGHSRPETTIRYVLLDDAQLRRAIDA